MGAESASEIVALFREACPSCKESYLGYDKHRKPFNESGGEPWAEIHNFDPKAQDGGQVFGVSFIPDSKGLVGPNGEPEASIAVFRFERPSLWQRIKGLWPS